MSTEAISLNLYKANAELQLRITQLLQQSASQWLETLRRANAENIGELTTEIEGLQQTATWQSLATLPAESFWRLFRQRTGDAQFANQIAIRNQAEFTTGLQQAIGHWQKAVATAIGDASAAQPLQDILRQWPGGWITAAPSQHNDAGKD